MTTSPADFDFRALESDEDRFRNQLICLDFEDVGVSGDSHTSGDLEDSERVLDFLDIFFDFFPFDFPVMFATSSPSLEKTSSSSCFVAFLGTRGLELLRSSTCQAIIERGH